MATRTVPTIASAGVTYKRFSVTMKDAGGEQRSVSLIVPNAVTDAQLEAVVATAQVITNASIFRASLTSVWDSAFVEANADTTPFVSVYDNLVLLVKNISQQNAQDAFVPAVKGILVLDGDVIDTTDTDYQAWRDAVVSALGAGWTAQTVRFTERRDKNDSVVA